jgi:cupin superfamily acireductone dioxygenase involved in methionine salvage
MTQRALRYAPEIHGVYCSDNDLVSIPFGENHRYDLIADDGERLLRIPVKTGRLRGAVKLCM